MNCFVVANQNKGTILDRIAKEIQSANGGEVVYWPCLLPDADTYIAMHYTIAYELVNLVKNVVCFFTHESSEINPYLLNQCKWIICENEPSLLLLKAKGILESKLQYIPEGGDSKLFTPHHRNPYGEILVCGTNYTNGRKNEPLLREVMNLLPNRQFKILGSNWTLPHNDAPYPNYPKLFESCSIYLSCSKLEGGGPNSLIESMHANLIPVVSDTGNARDYINHGHNGFIFPTDSKPEHIVALINRAYKHEPMSIFPFVDIFKTVTHFTWEAYGKQWSEYLSPVQTSVA